jgi:hypothetical protein
MDIQEVIKLLRQIDLSNYPCKEVLKLIESIPNCVHQQLDLPPSYSIYRARENENGISFSSKSELTYKQQSSKDGYKRASTPDMTMFYGSILPDRIEDGEINEIRAVVFPEAMPWVCDSKNKGRKKITLSTWNVIEKIKLIGIVQYSDFSSDSYFLKKLREHYDNSLDLNIEIKEDSRLFTSFIANEFAKKITENDYDYLISALFAKSIVDKGYDGVFYPSVKRDGTGYNVALTPYAAENKIQLAGVVE